MVVVLRRSHRRVLAEEEEEEVGVGRRHRKPRRWTTACIDSREPNIWDPPLKSNAPSAIRKSRSKTLFQLVDLHIEVDKAFRVVDGFPSFLREKYALLIFVRAVLFYFRNGIRLN